MENVIIYGNGSVAEVMFHYLTSDSPYNVVAFTVDDNLIDQKEFCELPLIPFSEINKIFPPKDNQMIIAVGYLNMNKIRDKKYKEAKNKGYRFINYISSRAHIWESIKIGENCVICSNVSIQPLVQIGNNVTIKENVFIAHNAKISDHCFISGGAAISGYVSINKYTFIGTNATIKNNTNIGKECIIGAGVTLLNDAENYEVYISKSSQKLPFPSDKISIK